MYWLEDQFIEYLFFQAEDGIRDAQESRGLGDVYKRQVLAAEGIWAVFYDGKPINLKSSSLVANYPGPKYLSLIHI